MADMRSPFDDAVFAALAHRHGVDRTVVEAATTKAWRRANVQGIEGLPATMPSFEFSAGMDRSGRLSIDLAYDDHAKASVVYETRGDRTLGSIWLHGQDLPETFATALKAQIGRPLREIVAHEGLEDSIVTAVTEMSGARMISFRREVRHD